MKSQLGLGTARLRMALLSFLARRPWVGSVLMALLGLALSVALSAFFGVPVPSQHDEFSYLLGADTFASGRIANPVHPMWASFESFHICVRPVYASMYPPGQSLFLALGQILGHPVIGVWISMATLGATAFWALSAFLAVRWALLGTSVLLFRLCTVDYLGDIGYWAYSYWGGAVAATGGALLLGGTVRLLRSWSAADGLLAAIGVGLLVVSRPYEGTVMALPCVAYFGRALLSPRNVPFRRVLVRSALPAAGVLLIVAAALGYYNFSTTGNPLKFARAACHEQYSETGSFLFSRPRSGAPIEFNHRVQAQWSHISRLGWLNERTGSGFVELTRDKLRGLWVFFFDGALGLPLLGLPWVLRSSPTLAFAAVTIAVELLGYLPVAFSQVHYMAPISTALYGLLAGGLTGIARIRIRRVRLGSFLILGWLGLVLAQSGHSFADLWRTASERHHGLQFERPGMVESLIQKGGKHLVIVRSSEDRADYQAAPDIVYNPASIDSTPVIFAREVLDCSEAICGRRRTRGSRNQELIQYFADRRVWVYETDPAPNTIALTPYPGPPDSMHVTP